MSDFPKTLEFLAEVEIQAESGDGAKRVPTFSMHAYSGGVLEISTFAQPIVVDLDGMSIPAQFPVHRDHDHSRLVGHAKARRRQGTLRADGVVSGSNEYAREVVESSKLGFPWQASIGADLLKSEEVGAEAKIEVNGQTFRGPLLVARKTRLREISFVSLGADATTSVTIAAKEGKKMDKDVKDMTFTEWLEARGIDPVKLSEETLKAFEGDYKTIKATAVVDEKPVVAPQPAPPAIPPTSQELPDALNAIRLQREAIQHYDRMAVINAHLSEFPAAAAEALRQNWNEDRIKLEATRLQRPKGPAIHREKSLSTVGAQAISCAILRQAGIPNKRTQHWTNEEWGLERWYEPQVLDASHHRDLRDISLHQILDMPIQRLNGGYGYTGNKRSQGFITAVREAMRSLQFAGGEGMTTLETTNIFQDVANKLLWSGYQSVQTSWQEWCNVHSVNDFKDHKVYRLQHTGAYKLVPAGGDLSHGAFADAAYTATAKTYAEIVGLNRQQLINDDLGALSNILQQLGVAAAQAIEEVAYVYLLSQANTTGVIWSNNDANLNYISGATTTVSLAGLTAAASKFENQIDASLRPIAVAPDRILVGTGDRVQASQLFNDTDVREGRGQNTTREFFVRNFHAGAFRAIVSPYLNNTAVKQTVNANGTSVGTQSGVHWWMFSDPMGPQGGSVIMALLNGNRTPVLEQSDSDFSMLGMQWRSYHDFGVSAGDPKLGVHSKGAA